MSLARSSFFFGLGTVISRVSGLVRDQVVLGYFGASYLLDAFLLAFRIPNLFREMLAEGALGSAFTKVYSQTKKEDEGAALKLLHQALFLTTALAVLLSCIGYLAAPYFVHAMTFLSETDNANDLVHHATGLTRLLFPYLGLTIIGSVAAGALYERGRFFLSAVSPLAFNLSYIFGALVLSGWLLGILPQRWEGMVADRELTGLALGVLIGGLAQTAFQLYSLLGDIRKTKFVLSFKLDSKIKDICKLMLPASLAASTGPMNLIVNTNFAASVGEGAITWLVASFRLMQLPVGVFGVAIGVVVLPPLSRKLSVSKGVVEEPVKELMLNGLSFVLWLMSASAVFLFLASEDVVQLLYQQGAFREADTLATSQALSAYSFAILAYGCIKVLTSFYYALERTHFAMYVALTCVLVNLGGNMLLVKSYGHVGLALTTSATLSVNCLLLMFGLRRYRLGGIYLSLLKQLIILALVFALAAYLQNLCLPLLNGIEYSGFVGEKLHALSKVILAAGIVVSLYLGAACLITRNSPRALLRELFRRKEE